VSQFGGGVWRWMQRKFIFVKDEEAPNNCWYYKVQDRELIAAARVQLENYQKAYKKELSKYFEADVKCRISLSKVSVPFHLLPLSSSATKVLSFFY